MGLQQQKWTIRDFQEGDSTQVLDLLRNAFAKEFTPEWFRWRYEAPPFGEPVLHVAESFSGQIVGFRALWYWPLIFESKEIPAYQAGDLAVAPDCRGQGMMLSFGKRGMEEAEKKGAWLRFGFANPGALPGAVKLGYRIVARLPMWMQILRPIRFFSNVVLAAQGRKPAEPLSMDLDKRHFLPAQEHIHDLVRLQEKSSFPGLRTPRREEFYRWRLSHPNRPCYLVSLDGKRPLMMVHLQKERAGGRALLMEQYIPAGSSEWKAALKMLHRSGKIHSIYAIASHCPEGRGFDFLKGGRLQRGASPTLILQLLREEAEPFLAKAKWDFTPLDMDFF